jgi:hypothetical protein
LTKYRVIAKVRLTPAHEPTGFTRHLLPSGEMPPPVELQIAQYPNEKGFYLFYLGDDGEVMTDTYHDTIERAFEQAELEFVVSPDEWQQL